MSKHRILLVEDSKPAQQAAKHLLTDLKCSVDIAGQGQKAIEQCDRVEYDLVLMDLSLHPGENGFEIAKLIRNHSLLNKNTPIVALSIHSEAQFHEQITQSQMNGFIAKPLSRFEAVELITLLDSNAL